MPEIDFYSNPKGLGIEIRGEVLFFKIFLDMCICILRFHHITDGSMDSWLFDLYILS